MNDPDEVDRHRKRIDQLDREILRLLNERSRLALAIGRIKRLRGIPIYDPQREASIVRSALEANEGPLEEAAIRRLFERILDESRRMERTAHEEGTT